MPYRWPADVILLAVAGRGVDRAGALVEGHVVGQHAHGVALQERVAEDGALELRACDARHDLGVRSSRTSRAVLASRSRGDQVHVAAHVRRHVLVAWDGRRWPCWPGWSRAWWSR